MGHKMGRKISFDEMKIRSKASRMIFEKPYVAVFCCGCTEEGNWISHLLSENIVFLETYVFLIIVLHTRYIASYCRENTIY